MRTQLKLAVTLVVVAAALAGPPILLHTAVYPVAIVRGNSMFPVLQNGELVVFRGVDDPYNIGNGTIIVFVEGDAPVNSLNYLVRPVVIHEVIGRVVNQYGRVYYQTKGVNNPYPDPGLTPASNIVGTPILEVPYAGFILLFFFSHEGLVALIGFLTIYYVEADKKVRDKEKLNRARFLVPFVFLNRGGKLSNDALIRLTYLAEHCEDLAKTELWNNAAQWLAYNLRGDWMYRVTKCDEHGDEAAEFYGKGVPTLRICVKGAEDILRTDQATPRSTATTNS